MNRAVRFEIAAGREAPLKLSKAILLYRGGNDAAFATVHEIGMQGSTPLILEGKALTPSAAVQLALDLGLMNASFSIVQGPYALEPTVVASFNPGSFVTRAEYAVAASRYYTQFRSAED